MPDEHRQACKKSLKDLEIDTIDLYYQHRVDPKTPIEDTVKAMAVCPFAPDLPLFVAAPDWCPCIQRA